MADLLALAELLAPRAAGGEDGEDAEEVQGGPRGALEAASRAGPGSVGPPRRASGPATPKGSVGGAIWCPEEVPEEGREDPEAAWDSRPPPEYEILFRQRVGAEDVFLGTSRRDPSSACCEEMLVKIRLPETRAADISLDVREKVLDLRSPQKKLYLHLPHPVDAKSGKASFFAEKGVLEVVLRMQRDLDFINFA